MEWHRVTRNIMESCDGHRVVCTQMRGRARYSAFSPAVSSDVLKRESRERYPIGCKVPIRYPLIGCYDSVSAAQAACAREDLD